MICSVISGTWLKDWCSTTTTATSARRNSISFVFQGSGKIDVFKVHSSSLGQHNRLTVKLKPTLDCNWGGCLTFLLFPLAKTFDTTTSAGHLRGGNGLGHILHFSNFNNIGDPNSMLTRRLSNNKRLDTNNTKPSFRGVPSILRANHYNIIRPF